MTNSERTRYQEAKNGPMSLKAFQGFLRDCFSVTALLLIICTVCIKEPKTVLPLRTAICCRICKANAACPVAMDRQRPRNRASTERLE